MKEETTGVAKSINSWVNTFSIFFAQIYDKILSFSSREGETIDCVKPVMAEGHVEVWLQKLLQETRASLHGIIRTAFMTISDQGFNLIEFLNTFPAQV